MEYRVLTSESVIEYIKSIDRVREYLNAKEYEVYEIGDGNLNYVYVIKSGERSVILKQAVPYLRCAGESWSLSKERMSYEINALQTFKELADGSIPEIFHSDKEMSVVIMQNLDRHKIMRKELIEAKKFPNFAEQISSFLATSLFKTSSLYLSTPEKRELMSKFNSNSELCKMSEDFVFSFAYMQHSSNNINPLMIEEHQKLIQDLEFKKSMLKLKYLFMNKTDALLHGDLHTGSIMLNEQETYIIDPEFAFFGPFGFDIGAVIANLIQSYLSHFERSKNEEFQEWIIESIREVFVLFGVKFLDLWDKTSESALIVDGFANNEILDSYKSDFMQNIFKESIGFAGAKMARRLFGIAGVEDILGITDLDARARVEKKSLEIAKMFVKNYEKIENVDEIIEIIRVSKWIK